MPNKLTNIDVAEVSLVRKPANKRAFLIYKALDMKEGGDCFMGDLKDKLFDVLAADLPVEFEEKIKLENASDEIKQVVKGIVKLLRAYKNDLPEDILEIVADIAELKVPERIVYQDKPLDEEEALIFQGLPQPVKKADGSYDLSSVPKEMRAIIEALWKQAEKAETLAKELKAEKQLRIKKEFEEKAAQFDNLPITTEELGHILRVFSEKAKEEYEKLERLLMAVNEALEQSALFKEVGSSHFSVGGDAWSKVEKMAESLIQKEQGLTKEKAIAKIFEMNPKLYEEYLREKINKGGECKWHGKFLY